MVVDHGQSSITLAGFRVQEAIGLFVQGKGFHQQFQTKFTTSLSQTDLASFECFLGKDTLQIQENKQM
jgi:hypothetical protein